MENKTLRLYNALNKTKQPTWHEKFVWVFAIRYVHTVVAKYLNHKLLSHYLQMFLYPECPSMLIDWQPVLMDLMYPKENRRGWPQNSNGKGKKPSANNSFRTIKLNLLISGQHTGHIAPRRDKQMFYRKGEKKVILILHSLWSHRPLVQYTHTQTHPEFRLSIDLSTFRVLHNLKLTYCIWNTVKIKNKLKC